jgi:hypothetical protein
VQLQAPGVVRTQQDRGHERAEGCVRPRDVNAIGVTENDAGARLQRLYGAADLLPLGEAGECAHPH